MHRMLMIVGLVSAVAFCACGSTSSVDSSCDCAICVNETPVYPSDSEASCTQYAADQLCQHSSFYYEGAESCGGSDQPHCNVFGCTHGCACPDV